MKQPEITERPNPKPVPANEHPFLTEYPFNEVIGLYRNPIARLYCHIRGTILRNRILSEIGQYVPRRGRVAECGCGFGLYSLCFAKTHTECTFQCCDLSAGRIQEARLAAARLHLGNVRFECRDALDFIQDLPPQDCIYMFDLVHHLPREQAAPFLQKVWEKIEPGGILIVKEIYRGFVLKVAFSWLLDVLMNRGQIPHYQTQRDFMNQVNFENSRIAVHYLDDYLPYPHILYLIRKNPLIDQSASESLLLS